MPHFTAFFPARETADPSIERTRLERAHRDGLRESSLHEQELDGAWLLTVQRGDHAPRLLRHDDGWAVVSGRLIDLDADTAEPSAGPLLEALEHGDDNALNRFEGVFAAAAWRPSSRTAWALNDQTSNLNLYYIERPEGLWVTTVALPLASALGLGLDAGATREFLSRGTLLTPASLFDGMRRLDLGERLEYRDGRVRNAQHWMPFQEIRPQRSLKAAATALSDLAVDRVGRFAGDRPLVSDLTGGYDSRMVVSAAAMADRLSAVTVEGARGHGDVEIALHIAERLGWKMHHFDPTKVWDLPIDPDLRRELTYRVNGELAFTEVYPHVVSRRSLAESFDLHFTGGGGELLRSFPWQQEFFGIGRRRRANVENALVYRFFQEGPPPPGLYASNWHPRVVDDFRRRLTELFDTVPDTLTTQQLDAAYLWRMTGFAPYTSAVQGWMASVAPLMCATTVDLAIALPWKMRLTSRLVRSMIQRQSPSAAALPTRYGGTSGSTRLTDLPRAAWQLVKQGYHLALKLDRVRLGGRLSRMLPAEHTDPVVRKPYLTPEFRAFLDPAGLRCRALFNEQGLRSVLEGDDEAWYGRERLILRIATLEQTCQELDWAPGPDFLDG